MAESILKEEVYQTVGAAMEVYYQLGCGFLEPIYQQALENRVWAQANTIRATAGIGDLLPG